MRRRGIGFRHCLLGGAGRKRTLKSRMRERAPPAAAARRAVLEFRALSRTIAVKQAMTTRGLWLLVCRFEPGQSFRSQASVIDPPLGRMTRAGSGGHSVSTPRRWDGASLWLKGLALVTLYPVGSGGRTIILRASGMRGPGWTGPIFSSGRPKGRGGHGSHPGRGGRREGAPAFPCRLRRASRQLLRVRGRSRGSARGRPPACAPWRRWRCA
jgi:hypothetical protein